MVNGKPKVPTQDVRRLTCYCAGGGPASRPASALQAGEPGGEACAPVEAQLAALRAALGEKQREVAAGRADLERRQALLRSAAGAPLGDCARRCWSWRLCSSSNTQNFAFVCVWAWPLTRVLDS